MALTVVTLEKQHRIGTLTLNRPEKLNALSSSLIAEFAEALDEVAADPDIKVLIIRGAGRAFSTGYDLSGGGRGTRSARRYSVVRGAIRARVTPSTRASV